MGFPRGFGLLDWPGPRSRGGFGVAVLLNRTQEVAGSSPASSIKRPANAGLFQKQLDSRLKQRSPLTDSNRRPPPYHRAQMREARTSEGSRGYESPAKRSDPPRTSDRARTGCRRFRRVSAVIEKGPFCRYLSPRPDSNRGPPFTMAFPRQPVATHGNLASFRALSRRCIAGSTGSPSVAK
jgi:hypothetical protein